MRISATRSTGHAPSGWFSHQASVSAIRGCGADRAEFARQPGGYRRLFRGDDLRLAQPLLAHRRACPAVEQGLPKGPVFFHMGAERPEPGGVVGTVADRQGHGVELGDAVARHGVEQLFAALVMAEESGVMDARLGADVAHGDLVPGLALKQGQQRLAQGLPGSHRTGIARA